MADLLTLSEAVGALVRDGDAVALEGFTHLIPFAAGHEVLRQGRRELELIRMTPDILYDQMVGVGAARRLVFSYAGNPGVGSLHRVRDAIEHDWPRAVEIEEHSHAGMANRYAAGASRLPFAVLRGYAGTDLYTRTNDPDLRLHDPTSPLVPVALRRSWAAYIVVCALYSSVRIAHICTISTRAGNVGLWLRSPSYATPSPT